MDKMTIIVQYFLFPFGIFLTSTGLFSLMKYYIATRNWIRVPGLVLSADQIRGLPSDTYIPIIKYETANGRKIQKKHLLGGKRSVYGLKKKVMVLYNPNKEEQFFVHGKDSIHRILLVLVIGLCSIAPTILTILGY
jgi:Protein of unknown function (DUF3592)